MTMNPKFKPTDIVTSVINPHFRGQITSTLHSRDQVCYTITFFNDGCPQTTNMYEYELELAPADKPGFLKKNTNNARQ